MVKWWPGCFNLCKKSHFTLFKNRATLRNFYCKITELHRAAIRAIFELESWFFYWRDEKKIHYQVLHPFLWLGALENYVFFLANSEFSPSGGPLRGPPRPLRDRSALPPIKSLSTSTHHQALASMVNGLITLVAPHTTSYVSFKIGTNIFLFTKENQRKEKGLWMKIFLLFSNLEKEN